MATVTDFGVLAGGTRSLSTKNTFTNPSITGLDGSHETTADQPTGNDFRTADATVQPPGGFNKYFIALPGTTGNTPPSLFSPGYPNYQGPPGGATIKSGDIQAAPTQVVLSDLTMVGSDLSNQATVSFLGCDSWDPTKLQLAAGTYPGAATGTGAGMQYVGSGPNTAVWMSGYNNVATGTGTSAFATSASRSCRRIRSSTGPVPAARVRPRLATPVPGTTARPTSRATTRPWPRRASTPRSHGSGSGCSCPRRPSRTG